MSFRICARSIGALIACTILLGLGPLWAQDNPVAPQRDIDVIKPQPTCPEPALVPVSILAHTYEMLGPIVRARGSLQFIKGKEHITASEAEYNVDTETGTLRDVSFTTCTAARPDFHLTASEVVLLPNHRIKVKNAALYIGTHRVLMLPWMRLHVGGRNSTSSVFPRIGYDARDGARLSQTFRLTDTTHSQTDLNLTLTTLHALEGDLNSRYGVGGTLVNLPGRYLTYGSQRSRTLEFPQPPAQQCDPQLLRPTDFAHLQPFGQFTLRQRTYSALNLGLVVFRQPELGVSYVGDQLSLTRHRLDPRIEIYPQLTASWGRYKEVPGLSDYIARSEFVALAPLNTFWLGPSTTIQPLGMMTYAAYGNDQTFRTWGAGIDIAHISNNGSMYSARYLSRTSSGSTPFQFDSIDIAKELDLGAQTYFDHNVLGAATVYDADNGTLFDWEIMAGRRSDCLATYVRWDNRFKRFSMDVTLINL